jgi:hypothetical protein
MLFEIAARNCRRYITTLANPDIVEKRQRNGSGKRGRRSNKMVGGCGNSLAEWTERLAARASLVVKAASRGPCPSGLHHALWLRFPVYYQFGMKAAKCFGHVTIPANRLMGGKYLRQLLGTQFSPLDCLVVWAE